MPWLVWRAVRKNAMAPGGRTDCTTWLKLVDEIRKTPLHEAPPAITNFRHSGDNAVDFLHLLIAN